MTGVPLSLPQANVSAEITARRGYLILAGLAIFALVLSVAARAFVGLQSSMWLDESWTGAFASEPTLGAVTQQIHNDINAPLYYYLMWGWAKLFGLSNLSLRLPSVLFSLATPVVAWVGLRRRWPSTALVWAALLALWLPGIALSGYARCYTLLLLAVTLNALAYWRALETPTRRNAAIWVATASIAVLVHYHTAFLALAEGVIFLAVHRRRALAAWPAALVATPALAWIAYQWPSLARFSRPEVAWYSPLTLSDLPGAATFLSGSTSGPLLLAATLLGAALLGRGLLAQDTRDGAFGRLWLIGAAALLGLVGCLIAAWVRPSFTVRYLTPFVPGAFLLVACALDYLGRGRWEPKAALIAAMAGLSILWMMQPHDLDRPYSFEKASAYIGEVKPDRLAFFWDHPATPFEVPAQLDRVGGFFLRRAGLPIAVTPVYPVSGASMTTLALKAAGAGGAILWLYDTTVHGTRAATEPPQIAQQDPRFECRDFGGGPIGVLACRRRIAP